MPTCLRSLPGRTKKKEDEDEDEDEKVGGGARERERRRVGGRERQRNRVEELAVVPVVSSREPRVQCHLLSLVDKRSLPESAPPSRRGKRRGEERERGREASRWPDGPAYMNGQWPCNHSRPSLAIYPRLLLFDRIPYILAIRAQHCTPRNR